MKKLFFLLILINFVLLPEILAQQITITSPNGGESWPAGTSRSITWSDNISEQVSIDLYKAGSYYYTITASTPSDAHHLWDIPDTLQGGSDYKIKITSVINSSIFDFSDGNFTIVGNVITVTSPNGGENWQAGSAQSITWSDNINEQVSIDLYKGGSYYYTITGATPSDGHHLWDIPDTLQVGTDYKIKITSVDFSSISDFSDNDFTVFGQDIIVTIPNGGESWPAGTSRSITWTDNISEYVSIELYKGGSYYYTVIDSTPSDVHHLWDIPDTAQGGGDYKIKITSVVNSNIFDFSDDDFTIISKIITVASPNGGENIPAGTSVAITWTDNISEYVSIDLFKGGFYYYTVIDSTPSDAHYTWYVPDTTQGAEDYKIKITSVINSSIFDISDGDFTITGNIITITSPNGGESWQPGSTHAITWSDNINEQVSIELYKAGSYFFTIIEATPSDAYYAWEISDTIQEGNDYKIKIASVEYSSIFDFSDDDLSISNTSVVEYLSNNIPDEFMLFQNYPNPFNPSAKIEFGLMENSSVSLKIYNIVG